MQSIQIDSDERLFLVGLSYYQRELNFKILETQRGYRLATTQQDGLMRHLAKLYFAIGIVEMNLTDQEKKTTENLINKILASARSQKPMPANLFIFPEPFMQH